MQNAKIATVIEAYQILPSNQESSIFLRSPQGVNFTLSVSVMNTLVRLLETDPTLVKKLGL